MLDKYLKFLNDPKCANCPYFSTTKRGKCANKKGSLTKMNYDWQAPDWCPILQNLKQMRDYNG